MPGPRVARAATRSIAAAAALALALAVAALAPPASAAPPDPPRPAAQAWVLVDARDGERLAARDPGAPRSIASATKLMTAYLALKRGRLDRRVAAPPYQALPAESLLGLEAGERVSFRDLVYALVLASANDGAVAVAEGVSGSVDRFVGEMNAAAERLGLDESSFVNPIGLDEPGNHSTAADLAALTTTLLEDPFFRRVADSTEHTVRTDRATRRIATRNDLLERVPWVTGVKTGYTIDAGNVLVGSGERKGVRLVAVVLGAPSEAARDEGVLSLLDFGFSLYRRATPLRKGKPAARPPVDSGGSLALVAARTLRVTARRDQQVRTLVDAPAELEGPVRRGQRLGRATATVDGRRVGSVPLVAASAASAPSVADEVRGAGIGLVLVAGAAVVILIAVALVLRARRSRQRG